jgi:hypothetical protein
MKVQIGSTELELGGDYLVEGFTDSTGLMDDAEALRRNMNEEGYLYIRGLHDPDRVREARMSLLNRLSRMGRLDAGHPVEAGIPAAAKDYVFPFADQKELPELLKVVNSSRVMNFFDRFLGGPSLTLDYKWPRAVAPGSGTGAHYDIVYMGRGTKQLYTMWTPLGDVPMELGALCICLGSHRFDRLLETYGKIDVSKDKIKGGWFSNDPIEIAEKFGSKWATIDFKAGDAIIFGMHTLHMSTVNKTGMYRTSCDTRYQLRSEPVDTRFMGDNPIPPGRDGVVREITVEELRGKWGL